MKRFLFTLSFLFLSFTVFAQTKNDRFIASAYAPEKKEVGQFQASAPLKVVADSYEFQLASEETQTFTIYLLDTEKNVLKQEKITVKGSKNLKYNLIEMPRGSYQVYIQGKKSFQVLRFCVSR